MATQKAPNTSPSWEQTLGGLEGHIDASDPTPRASPNCAGYAIQEIFGKSGNYSADDLLVRLEGSGAVEKRTSPDFAEVGDLVFYALPGSGAAHVAVVDERLGRPQATYIGVRNKDNASPVFRAALTATYYTGQGWEPRIFTFPQGKPRLILDPDPALATHPNFCQFDAGHVEGVIR